jgi:hypothetical protein
MAGPPNMLPAAAEAQTTLSHSRVVTGSSRATWSVIAMAAQTKIVMSNSMPSAGKRASRRRESRLCAFPAGGGPLLVGREERGGVRPWGSPVAVEEEKAESTESARCSCVSFMRPCNSTAQISADLTCGKLAINVTIGRMASAVDN